MRYNRRQPGPVKKVEFLFTTSYYTYMLLRDAE